MADDSGIDCLMKISVTGGSLPMDAESLTDFVPLASGDPLLKGFKTGQFCELVSFGFSAGAENSLGITITAPTRSATAPKPPPMPKPKSKTLSEDDSNPPPRVQANRPSPRGEFVARMSATVQQRAEIESAVAKRLANRERGDFVDMREVKYDRIMDVASIALFKALTESTTLASVTIVKRKAAGTSVSGMGYLRLDFEEVLFTKLDWNDSGHVMMESGTFIYRKLTIDYLAQKADGSLIPGSSAVWKMKTQRTGT